MSEHKFTFAELCVISAAVDVIFALTQQPWFERAANRDTRDKCRLAHSALVSFHAKAAESWRNSD